MSAKETPRARTQGGRLFIEMIGVIFLIIMLTPLLYRSISDRQSGMDDANSAAVMRDIASAARAYIQTNRAVIVGGGATTLRDWQTGLEKPGHAYPPMPTDNPNYSASYVLGVEEVADFLPHGFQGSSRAFTDYKIALRREWLPATGGGVGVAPKARVSALVAAFSGSPVDAVRGNRMAGMIGPGGGYIYPDSGAPAGVKTGWAYGSQGLWSVPVSSYFGAGVSVPKPGSVVALSEYSSDSDAYVEGALYRDVVPGFPEANRMMTDLDMTFNNLSNVRELDARYIGLARGRDCPAGDPSTSCARNIEIFGQNGRRGAITLYNAAGDTSSPSGYRATGDVSVVINGDNGSLTFTEYRDPYDPLYDSAIQNPGVESTRVVGGDNYGGVEIRDGQPVYGVKGDGLSTVKDIRIEQLGGALLSEVVPRVSLMAVHKGVPSGTFVPAPGFDDKGNQLAEGGLCPVGHAPIVSVFPASRKCGQTYSSGMSLEQLRCLWPNADYLPLGAGLDINETSAPQPLRNVFVQSASIGAPGSSRYLFAEDRTVSGGGSADPRDVHSGSVVVERVVGAWNRIKPTYISQGFTPIYDDVKCVNDVPSVSKYADFAPQIICTGDAVFGRSQPSVIGATLRPRTGAGTGANSKFMQFEVCRASAIAKVDNSDAPLSEMRRIYTAPECPYESGWGFAMRNRKPTSHGPYYFIRMPIDQFSAIYYLIAGTYTPFLLVSLRGPLGWSLLAVVWAMAAGGTVLQLRADISARWSVALYLAMGWLIVFASGRLFQAIPPHASAFIVAGGLAYTAGCAFYVMKSRRYAHAVWHLFVLAGTLLHFFAVLFGVVLA